MREKDSKKIIQIHDYILYATTTNENNFKQKKNQFLNAEMKHKKSETE